MSDPNRIILKGTIKSDIVVNGIVRPKVVMVGRITTGTSTNKIYDGDYIVIPKAWESTVLETKDKLMEDEVTVTEIPYAETSNEYGKTVTIGG